MRQFYFLLFLSLYHYSSGQTTNEKLIHGKITVTSGSIEGVNIVNLVNENSTVSNEKGEFFILAKADDVLVFSSVNLEYHRKLIEENDLKTEILLIKLTSKTTALKEVVVTTYPHINAISLGISPRGIKKYTAAERRLYTANSTPIDALINMLSGRTEMLKKGIEVEKKERLISIMDAIYKNDYYITNALKIPIDYIKGFQYYCVEDKNFAEVLLSKNKTKIEFLIIPLAETYKKILENETK